MRATLSEETPRAGVETSTEAEKHTLSNQTRAIVEIFMGHNSIWTSTEVEEPHPAKLVEMSRKSGDHGKSLAITSIRGDRGKSLAATSVQGDHGKSPHVPHKSTLDVDEEVFEEEIFYSKNPMETVRKALKRENIELLGLISIRPMTEEINKTINELKAQIHSYGEFLKPESGQPTETFIGSIDAPVRPQHRHSILVRLVYSPKVGLESNDEHIDFEKHDMPEKGHTDIGTPHDVGDEPSVECEEAYPGAARVKSTVSLDVTFMVDDDCVPIKIQKIAGEQQIDVL